MPRFTNRLKHAWNAFFGRDAPDYADYGPSSSQRPDRKKLTRGNSRSIVAAIYNRIAMDVASVSIRHVRLDDTEHYKEVIHSGLNECLSVEANMDQTARAFIQDVVMSLFDEGCVAIVPTETDLNPLKTGAFDILSMRTGRVTQWHPNYVNIEIYNERTGRHQEIVMPKKAVCLIENPLYAVMNEPNSTLQRLQRKLVLLDMVDEETSSGKLNMLIQLPYTVKSPLRKAQAEARRTDMENQLSKSKYGVAYVDATEKVTQLNRPLDNGLMDQIEYLTTSLYNQLGLTSEIFDGTADEAAMLNYNNRTIEPILAAITDEIKRKWLTKTARSQRQSIMFFRDPFRLCPVNNLADIADRFTRNEIMSSNEFRAILGMKPVDSDRANELVNKNMPVEDLGGAAPPMMGEAPPQPNAALDVNAMTALLNTPMTTVYSSEYSSQNG